MPKDPIFANLVVAEFIHQVEAFARLEQRLLTSFGDIAQQARDESDRVWREHQSQPGEGDSEGAAEAASDAAIDCTHLLWRPGKSRPISSLPAECKKSYGKIVRCLILAGLSSHRATACGPKL